MRGITGSLGAIAFILLLTLAVYAEALENVDTRKQATEAGSPPFQTDLDQPATTVEDWVAQIEGASAQSLPPSSQMLRLIEIEHPHTSVELLTQELVPTPSEQSPGSNTVPAPEIVKVTGVKANPTDKSVEVILQRSFSAPVRLEKPSNQRKESSLKQESRLI
jgi:hypothetical protein